MKTDRIINDVTIDVVLKELKESSWDAEILINLLHGTLGALVKDGWVKKLEVEIETDWDDFSKLNEKFSLGKYDYYYQGVKCFFNYLIHSKTTINEEVTAELLEKHNAI